MRAMFLSRWRTYCFAAIALLAISTMIGIPTTAKASNIVAPPEVGLAHTSSIAAGILCLNGKTDINLFRGWAQDALNIGAISTPDIGAGTILGISATTKPNGGDLKKPYEGDILATNGIPSTTFDLTKDGDVGDVHADWTSDLSLLNGTMETTDTIGTLPDIWAATGAIRTTYADGPAITADLSTKV